MALPSGFDRADGVNWFGEGGLNAPLGTPSPAGSVQVQSANGATALAEIPIEEEADSPQIERAEQATITHRFTMGWEQATIELQHLGRGLVRTDAYGNVTKLLSATIERVRPGTARLTTVEESISFDSPPDQFAIVPIELGISIIKHPRYFYAFLGTGYGSDTELKNQMVIRFLQDYFETPTAAFRSALQRMLVYSFGDDGSTTSPKPEYKKSALGGDFYGNSGALGKCAGTDLAKAAALEIITKYWRNTETPYIVGWQISWSAFYFRPPFINPGGYEEIPWEATPQLPDYFWANAGDGLGVANSTIFDNLDTWNPQCYSSTGVAGEGWEISWLRKADEIDYERTWFKCTRTWVGSPIGFWDTELYSQSDRPSAPTDYRSTAEFPIPTA